MYFYHFILLNENKEQTTILPNVITTDVLKCDKSGKVYNCCQDVKSFKYELKNFEIDEEENIIHDLDNDKFYEIL